LSIADLPTNGNAVVSDSKEYLSDEGAARGKIVKQGTLLVSFKLTLGRLAYAGCDLRTNEAIAALSIRDTARIEKEYLFWYLTYFDWGQAAEGEDKVKGKTLNKAKLKDLPILVPLLEEQRRIVAVLDEAFAAIATATANAEKNLANARELFEARLRSTFDHAQAGWIETQLGKVCIFENGDRGANYPNRSEYVQSGIPWINTGHIKPDGTLSLSDMNYITAEKFASLRSGKIKEGDLVYCLRGATLGKTAMVSPLTEGAVASSLVIVRPRENLDTRFVYYFLTSPFGQEQIRRYENGAAQPNLGAKSVAQFKVFIPPLSEQRNFVEQLDKFRAECQCLEVAYTAKLDAISKLKQSLLHRAFTGELTSRAARAAARNDNFATPEFAAKIVAFAYERHVAKNRVRNFGTVKAEKILHMVEAIGGIDLGRQPVREAAGPDDARHRHATWDWARSQRFFRFSKRSGGGHDFEKLPSYSKMIEDAKVAISVAGPNVERAIDLLVDMDRDFAELVTTTYAAWNNLIIDQWPVTDDEVVRAARDDWHRDKMRFDHARFHDAIRFLRSNSIVPDGSAKRVGGQEALLF